MRFVTSVYGEKYVAMLLVHLKSIQDSHPGVPVSVYYDDISDTELKLLQASFKEFDFVRSPIPIHEADPKKRIPLKLKSWSTACQQLNDEVLCFVDCDTAVRLPIEHFIDDSFDVLYTWKDEKFPLNTGVVILKNSLQAKVFLKQWLSLTEDIIHDPIRLENAIKENGAADQQALYEMLNSNEFASVIEATIQDVPIRFKGVPCKYLNETNSVPITEDTHIIHYKAGWQPILLEGAPFTKNRGMRECKPMYDLWHQVYRKAGKRAVEAFVLDSCEKFKSKFENSIGIYEERGILHSEMLAVCSVIENLGVDIVLESGRCRGQSTEVLAKYFLSTKIKIVSVEFVKDENAL